MKIKLCLLVGSILLYLLVSSVMAQYFDGIYVDKGFLNGNRYLSMEKGARTMYVCGVRDGMLIANIMLKDHSDKEVISAITKYTQNMPPKQVDAIVEKYIRDNPHIWNDPMHGLIYSALLDSILTSKKGK